jgi:RsiW-degrading membrane proteinase PrsW (M82 family)
MSDAPGSSPTTSQAAPVAVMDTSGAISKLQEQSLVMKWLVPGIAAMVFFIAGLIVLGIMGSIVGIGSLIVAMIVAILPVPIYISMVLWLDRFEAEPPMLLAMAFLWGATVSCLFSFIFNTLGGTIIYSIWKDANTAGFVSATVCAPLFEEFSKGLVLFILFWWKKDEFDGVIDGVMYATMVALGFAMTENFLYYGRGYAQAGAGGLGTIFIMRGLISPLAHPLFTSMTGIGLGLTRHLETRSPMKYGLAVLGLGMAMFLHFAWNLSASINGLMFIVVYLVVMIPCLLAVLGAIIYSLFQEQKVLRKYLETELRNGIIDQADFECCCSAMKRLGVTFNALTKGGLNAWKARMLFHQTASELAFHRHRVSRGILGKGYTPEEREAYYLERLKQFRAACGCPPASQTA